MTHLLESVDLLQLVLDHPDLLLRDGRVLTDLRQDLDGALNTDRESVRNNSLPISAKHISSTDLYHQVLFSWKVTLLSRCFPLAPSLASSSAFSFPGRPATNQTLRQQAGTGEDMATFILQTGFSA